jgi:16S rRNA (cytidine1402-2'-O)-methyltransferase
MSSTAETIIYLIPTFLAAEARETIPDYVREALEKCEVIFAENERTTRRFMKSISPKINIDSFEWHTIDKNETNQIKTFTALIASGKKMAIVSEAGCPGVADPGQLLIAAAQEMHATIKPLVGPSSILLALMGSGMNGQQFEFCGYLPIDTSQRIKKIKELEQDSLKKNSTKIFIETPYRNNQLLECILQHAQSNSRLCIAANLTAPEESIKTLTIHQWKKAIPNLHKIPVIFLLHA